jgi:GntR family transcriptional repressor for pyruvate dehydrogenase complex
MAQSGTESSLSGMGPVVRQERLSDQVASMLREEIANSSLRPGDHLPSERELCERFGVSRTVIREAVKTLTAKGLVTSTPGSGLAVGTTTIDDVAEIFEFYFRGAPTLHYRELHEVRYTLETSNCMFAAQRASAEETTELLRLCDELETFSEDDLIDASRNDAVFHRNIAVATHNSNFVVLMDAIDRALLDTRVATFSMDPGRIRTVSAAHRKIATAIADHQPEDAASAMRQHLDEVLASWIEGTSEHAE